MLALLYVYVLSCPVLSSLLLSFAVYSLCFAFEGFALRHNLVLRRSLLLLPNPVASVVSLGAAVVVRE